jgi:hypothetical protein
MIDESYVYVPVPVPVSGVHDEDITPDVTYVCGLAVSGVRDADDITGLVLIVVFP